MKDDRHEQYADWITRYYSSHKYIPDGHSDGELIGKLIHCKDCKHYWEEKHFCIHTRLSWERDGFCSDAIKRERKE